MSKIISKSNDGRKGNITFESIQDFCFFLYLIATTAHQTGEGFDAIFIRASFVLFVGFSILQMIVTHYFKWNGFIAWFLVFLGYGYLSTLWAADVTAIGYYSNTFVQLVGCIICLSNRIKKREDIDKCLKLMLYSLLYTIAMLFIRTPVANWGTERIGEDIGVHSNDIGLRFALGVLIALYFAMSKKKYFCYLYVVLFTGIAMFSGSRKGILMCVIIIAIYPLFAHGKRRTGKDLLTFIFQIILIIVVIGVLFYLVMNVETLYNIIGVRIESMLDDSIGDASIDERNYFTQKAIELFKEHPVLGYGMDNFRVYMGELSYTHQTYSHNNYLELLSTLGLIGFGIYYSIVLKMLVDGFKVFFKRIDDRPRNTLFILMLSLILFISIWQIMYQNEFIMILFVLYYMNTKLYIEDGKIKV